MSLEHELVELNGAYQETVATNLALRERNQQLEELLSEYELLAENVPDIGSSDAFLAWETRRMRLQQRAQQLLG